MLPAKATQDKAISRFWHQSVPHLLCAAAIVLCSACSSDATSDPWQLSDDASVDGQSVDAGVDTGDAAQASCNPPQIEPTVPLERACGFIDSYACYDDREYRCEPGAEAGDQPGLVPTGRDCCQTPVADMGIVDFSAETISYRGPQPASAAEWQEQCKWEDASSRDLEWKIRFRGTIANRGNRATRVQCSVL